MLKKSVSAVVVSFSLVVGGCAGVDNVSDATNLINGKLKAATDAVNDWVGPLSNGGTGAKGGNSDWKPISERVGRTSITETKLDDIFSEHPYNENVSLSRQYPRVALTINTVPDHHDDTIYVTMNDKLTLEEYEKVAGCWDLTATVWENSNNSEVVDFGWCYPDDQDATIHGRLVGNWITSASIDISLGGRDTGRDTGRKRTTGPLPPAMAFPNDLAHKKFLSGLDVGGMNTYDRLMIGSIMDQMGFDYTIDEDKRFWIVRFEEAK